MAELEEGGDIHSGRGKKRGGVRAKKMSTRIDMTPMVDLGFLLVTFFILTTTMNKPKAMQLVMPDIKDKTDTTKVPESEAMTILLGGNDRIFYYFGINDPKVETANFKTIRTALIDKNKEVREAQRLKWGNDSTKVTGPVVLIKPTPESKYANLVDILDEMKITGVGRYAIVNNITEEEKAMLPQQ